jgi:hypothetical protein
MTMPMGGEERMVRGVTGREEAAVEDQREREEGREKNR